MTILISKVTSREKLFAAFFAGKPVTVSSKLNDDPGDNRIVGEVGGLIQSVTREDGSGYSFVLRVATPGKRETYEDGILVSIGDIDRCIYFRCT